MVFTCGTTRLGKSTLGLGILLSLWASLSLRCPATEVDATTLDGRLLCGYQAWFTAAGDENPFSSWIHWGRDHRSPDGSNLLVEMYPDLSEFDADELFPTAMTKEGKPACLYSGRTAKTVRRHVRWMSEYGIDGAFAQRFVVTLQQDAGYASHLTAALENLKAGCEEYGRVFAVMYDVSGADESMFRETMRADWIALVDSGLTDSPRYLRHNGRPVVGIWGMGFKDRVPSDPSLAMDLIDWFKRDAPEKYRATVFGGVPGGWRTLTDDSRTDPVWATVYRSFDVLSPWTVGRYSNQRGADAWKARKIVPDMAEANADGIVYCPVIWPGFSWKNLTGGPANQIPRAGGDFFWRQAFNAISAGARTVYVAMFDEVDEGTAIYKVAPTAADTPDQGHWLTLDADGITLPSDWYLRLAGEAGRMLRGEVAPSEKKPCTPAPVHPQN